MDMGDSYMGKASYAPGGQWGSGDAANNYALHASQMGAAINQANTAAGQNYSDQLMGVGYNAGGQAPQYAMNAQGGLSAQDTALDQYRIAAQGGGPSAADSLMQSGTQNAVANAQSQAASTRGNFGLANAQKNALGAASQASQNAVTQGSQLRAQEQQNAMAGYAGLGSTIQQQQSQNQQNAVLNQLAAYGAANQAAYGWTGMGQQNQLNYNQLGQQALTSQLNADVANQQSTNQQASANAGRQQQGMQGIASMLSSAFSGAMSDERAKEDIHHADAPVWQQLDAFRPETFRYRNPDDAPNPEAGMKPHLGVLAQDVERGPAGATLIRHDESGMKHLDAGNMMGVLAAGAGALKRRTDDHDERLSRLESLLGGR